MKSWKKILPVPFLAVTLLLLQSVPAMAAVTEADVQAVGKETAAGNVLIWFLCAIAFLKISQKIDSFMSSLGIKWSRSECHRTGWKSHQPENV